MKNKKSGANIFMDILIVITLITSSISFILYYGEILFSQIILWIGIVAFIIFYQFWLRIMLGKLTKLFKFDYMKKWFKGFKFEIKLYNFFKVKRWKNKVLTFEPESFSLEKNSLQDIARTMCKVEIDHWINVLISISTILFSLIWGQFLIFLIVAILAILFDFQFIMIQRYNRPKIINIILKKQNRVKNKI